MMSREVDRRYRFLMKALTSTLIPFALVLALFLGTGAAAARIKIPVNAQFRCTIAEAGAGEALLALDGRSKGEGPLLGGREGDLLIERTGKTIRVKVVPAVSAEATDNGVKVALPGDETLGPGDKAKLIVADYPLSVLQILFLE